MGPERLTRIREEAVSHSALLSTLFNPDHDYLVWQTRLWEAVEALEDAISSQTEVDFYSMFIETHKNHCEDLKVFPDTFDDENRRETTRLLFLAGFEIGNAEPIEVLQTEVTNRVVESCHPFDDQTPWAKRVLLEGAQFRIVLTAMGNSSNHSFVGMEKLVGVAERSDYYSTDPIPTNRHVCDPSKLSSQ